MLGNDIVDLQLAFTQSNWRRKGYLNKIFTNEEQQEIWNAPNPETMVWLFWSMKEAAYKIVNRESLQRFYSPKSFKCFVNFSEYSYNGKVVYEEYEFNTVSEVTTNFINTTAISGHNRKFEHYLFNNEGSYIQQFNEFSNQFRLIKDERNLPIIQNLFTEEFWPASVSHHGRYISIVHIYQFEPI